MHLGPNLGPQPRQYSKVLGVTSEKYTIDSGLEAGMPQNIGVVREPVFIFLLQRGARDGVRASERGLWNRRSFPPLPDKGRGDHYARPNRDHPSLKPSLFGPAA